VLRSRVTGLRIKPANKGEDVYPFEPIPRTRESIWRWGTWVREMVETYEKDKDNFEYATRYTHSCQRFFRPCSLLAFCADSPEGRQEAWTVDMVPAELSPSERAVQDV
jgi:hypothetical protein